MQVRRTFGPAHARLEKLIADAKKKQASVGWFESAKYMDGTPVAYVATIQEFGYAPKNIPARPFMRPTITAKGSEWKDIAKQGAKAVLSGSYTIDGLFEIIGQKAAGDIREAISKISDPALKQSTIDARKRRAKSGNASVKPLVDTGHMIGTLTSIVEDKQ